jgi:hypothetical protein
MTDEGTLKKIIASQRAKILTLLPNCTAFPKGTKASADCGHLGKGKCWAYPEFKCQSQESQK